MTALPSKLIDPYILLVDDDRHVRLFLKSRLAFLGGHIHMVLDGQEALDTLEVHRPDLILSDAVMPRVDGFELCKRVKEDPFLATIPFVVLTSLSQNVRERSLLAGADDYLSKSENDLIFQMRMRFLLEISMRGIQSFPGKAAPSILVVSRSRTIHAQLLTQLSGEGIHVLGVSSPGEVMNHLALKGADALLLDMTEDPDSLHVLLGNLRNHPVFADTPVMALATKAEEPLLATMEMDVQDRLLKPLDAQETRHRIRLLLRLARPHGAD